MEEKINALMIRGVDYKDNDKMLTLYSLEKGKVGAGIKGVKKAGAKLTFCAMPFCFAEYVLNVKGDKYSVIGATEIESFYKLRLSVQSFYAASAVAEFLLKFTEEGEVNEELFYSAVNALKSMCFDEQPPEISLIKFWAGALKSIGYGAEFFYCGKCGKTEISSRAFFDFSAGKFVCENCAGENAAEIMPSTLNAVRYCLTCGDFSDDNGEFSGKTADFSKIENALPEKGDFLRALKFLNHYTLLKLGERLNSVSEYVKLA